MLLLARFRTILGLLAFASPRIKNVLPRDDVVAGVRKTRPVYSRPVAACPVAAGAVAGRSICTRADILAVVASTRPAVGASGHGHVEAGHRVDRCASGHADRGRVRRHRKVEPPGQHRQRDDGLKQRKLVAWKERWKDMLACPADYVSSSDKL